MEIEKLGSPTGYRSQCMRYLFPIPNLALSADFAVDTALAFKPERSELSKEWFGAIFHVLRLLAIHTQRHDWALQTATEPFGNIC